MDADALRRIEAKLDLLLHDAGIEWYEPKDPTKCVGLGDMEGVWKGYSLLRHLAVYIVMWQKRDYRSDAFSIWFKPQNDETAEVTVLLEGCEQKTLEFRRNLLASEPVLASALRTSARGSYDLQVRRDHLLVSPNLLTFLHCLGKMSYAQLESY